MDFDDQKTVSLILKELNALASKRDPQSVARKNWLMQEYKRLMGIGSGSYSPKRRYGRYRAGSNRW